MRKHHLCIFAVSITLTACATYHAKPLNTQPTLLRDVPHLTIHAEQIPLPDLTHHLFNPDDGLDLTEVSMLAVVNNPELKSVRDERGIARAELMAAGILPNPQLSVEGDRPTNGSGNVDAFNAGLDFDLSSLLTRQARIDAANAHTLSIDLAVLWQEWQVVQQARLLFVDSLEQEKKLGILRAVRDLRESEYQHAEHALEAGDLPIDVVSADMAALQDVTERIRDLERQQTKTRHDLNSLLGLSPDVNLRLTDTIDLPELDRKTSDSALARLPQRRPDLLALQAGYTSEEARFRKAVLAQFPDLSVGFIRSRDTSGIYTTGIGITLSLPIFDRNQGAIAVEKATRTRLYDEYQARLNKAYSEARGLLDLSALTENQYKEVKDALPDMEQTAGRAKTALDHGDLDIATYTDLQTALLQKRIEIITLEQTLLEQRIALQTVLGNELPRGLSGGIALEQRRN